MFLEEIVSKIKDTYIKKINIYKLLILFGSEIIQYSSFVLLCHGFRMISFIKQTLINKSLLRR